MLGVFGSAAAGIEIKLAVNGSNNFTSTFCVDSLVKIQLLPRTCTEFCVQPRWSHDDFLHSASQRLNLVSKAIVAFDGNGTNIEQLPSLLCLHLQYLYTFLFRVLDHIFVFPPASICRRHD